jgi:hypothetical protein
MWGNVGQRIEDFSYTGGINSRDLLYNVVTTVNNNALFYSQKLLMVDFKCSYHKKLSDVMTCSSA